MCTLIVLYKLASNYPILVAANRDESYTRKSALPDILNKNPLAWGGRDLEAGGTWLGFNQRGLLVGITNRFTPNPPDRSRRSRGLLCLEALSFSTASEVREFLEKEGPGRYNSFNLFYADPTEAYVSYDQNEIRTVSLSSGIYVLNNQGDINDRSLLRTRTVLDQLQNLPYQDVPAVVETLKRLCGKHSDFTTSQSTGICIHGNGYGTVSSSIIALGNGKYPSLYLHAEGKPCLSSYHDYSSMLFKDE